MISSGNSSLTLEELHKIIPEKEIVAHYLNVNKIPCLIKSPLRADHHPSMGIYTPNGTDINYIDFSTNERGRYYKLLAKLWNTDIQGVINTIVKDFTTSCKTQSGIICRMSSMPFRNITIDTKSKIELKCKIRDWEEYDIEYWNSYGISLPWLKYAEIYPISHKIILKDNIKTVFRADKYAYAFIERKEGKVTMKIYQPFNKEGYKWSNAHDGSVISLWTKIPEKGEKVVICSSVKDALCLWANIGIPALALQGEGYSISNTAISELKRRYDNVYILFDNDKPGLKDGIKLSAETGFTNLVLPQFIGGKDVSDLYKTSGKEKFKNILKKLF